MKQYQERFYLKTVALLLLAVMAPGMLAAQQASIEGAIHDRESGEPLVSANIAVAVVSSKDLAESTEALEGGRKGPEVSRRGQPGTTKGTSSDTSGRYHLEELAPGTYVLTASYVGYRKFEREVTLEEGQHLQLDIPMAPEDYRLGEIVVETGRDLSERRDIGVARLGSDLVKDLPSLFQEDVFRSLQMLPGVKSASEISSGLYIRGGSPDQTLIRLDGATIYNPSHFFGFFSTFNPDAVEDITFYKGGYPARYGGRLGSVVDLHNKTGHPEEFHGSLSLGLMSSRASLEGPLPGGGSWMLAARRSTLEPALSVLQDYEDTIPEEFYFMDLNGKLTFTPTDNNIISVGAYSGYDNLDFPYSASAGINLNYGNQVGSFSWRHLFSDRWEAELSATGSRYEQFPSFDVTSTNYERYNRIEDYTGSATLRYFSEAHRVRTGFEMGRLILHVEDHLDGNNIFTSYRKQFYGSWFLEDEWHLSDSWIATPGVRVSGFGRDGYLRVAPRASLEFAPSERFRLQGAYGRYHQYLSQGSGQMVGGTGMWVSASEQVPPAYGDQFVFGIKTIPLQNFSFDVEVYYRTMESLFELDPNIPDRSGLDYHEAFRFGEGFAYGAEVMLERRAGALTGFASYTLGVTRRKFPGYNEAPGGGGAAYYPPRHDRLHDFKVMLDLKFSSRWSANAVFSYATGQPYTRPVGRTTAFDLPMRDPPQHQILVGRVNASRQPDYHRLDFGLTRRGSFFGLGESELQLQAVNVYSRRNIWFYDYNLSENPAERTSVKLLPVIPTVSYTINF